MAACRLLPKPLSVAGHDGLWYWKQARIYAQKKQIWNAGLLSTAVYLLQPAGFSSANLEKLVDEQQAAVLPICPMQTADLHANGGDYIITGLRTDDALGGLDLVAHYNSAGNQIRCSPNQHHRRDAGLLALHPELREAFHGLWVFADAKPEGSIFAGTADDSNAQKLKLHFNYLTGCLHIRIRSTI